MYSILILGSAVVVTVCAGLYFSFRSHSKRISGTRASRLLTGIMVFLLTMLCLSTIPVFAAENAEDATTGVNGLRYIGASLAIGLACIGAGIAVAYVGAAALGVVGEKPDLLGKTLIYLGLAEGIAVYGIVISILILLT
ncbi:MAG: ATP synthase subunit C [Synergistaceae bacterium]|nr:ATP synthase subunit C [Synergistaceae bacterium]